MVARGNCCAMAIYHCSLRTFSRADGHSAVAAAAYRAGELIKDDRTGRTHRYHKRTGVADTFILLPTSTHEKFLSRALLWNEAEASENRKNSRVAREVIVALPHELSDKARAELTRDMGLYLMERYRVAVDVAIHSPVAGEGSDPRNHHAHLLFTTREVTTDGLGVKTRILDDKVTGPQEVETIREVWEALANDALKRSGFTDVQIDHRTLTDQGIDRIPQIHEGKAARNTDVSSSLLAADFKKAEQYVDEDGEDEGDGGNSSSSGGQSLHLQSQVREDQSGRNIDFPVIDQERTRLSFNDEIKALNERRAEFLDKPLVEQIEQLDRLMAYLDRRLEKLQKLDAVTTFHAAIKHSISYALHAAISMFSAPEINKPQLYLRKEEQQKRTERQIKRYGRVYREGVHSQIKEMQQNIQILEQKQSDFRRYKSFVENIERSIRIAPLPIKIENGALDGVAPPVTDKEFALKFQLKVQMIHDQIADKVEFRPPLISLDVSDPIQPNSSDKVDMKFAPAIQNSDLKTPLMSASQESAHKPNVRKDFEVHVGVADKSATKISVAMKVEGLGASLLTSQSVESTSRNPERREEWFVAASDETRPFIRKVEGEVNAREIQRAEVKIDAIEIISEQREYKVFDEVLHQRKLEEEIKLKQAQAPPQFTRDRSGYKGKTIAIAIENLMHHMFGMAVSQRDKRQVKKMSNVFNNKVNPSQKDHVSWDIRDGLKIDR